MKDIKSLDMSHNYLKALPDLSILSKKLKKLNLSHNSVREYELKNKIVNLTSLNLSSNGLKSIPEQLATEFPKLEFLNLSSNLIKQIDPNLFSKFNALKKLVFKNNQVLTVPEELLSNLKNLESLNLSENKIYFKPYERNDVFNSNKLKKLKLRENWICFLPDDLFQNLKALTHLDISNNQIESISEKNFSKLRCLTHLDLSDNNLYEIPDEFFQSLVNVKILNLSKNQIEKVIIQPGEVPHFKKSKIESLSLADNKLKKLEEEFFNTFSELKHLDLSVNELETLSENFKSLDKLEKLILKNNKISDFADKSFNVNLKKLNLSKNQLTSVSIAKLNYLNNLIWLDLSENKIVKIPDDFIKSDVLTHLNLSKNEITSLKPSIFSKVKYITHLKLNDNKINSLKNGFIKDLIQLNYIDLSGNRLLKIQKNAFKMKSSNLETINLSRNKIFKIDPKSFCDHVNLTVLNLHSNELKSFSNDLLDGLANLNELNLSGNKFQTTREEILLNNLASLEKLDLSSNEFNCVPKIENLPNLKELNLSNNLIQTLDDDNSFVGLNELKILKLNLNDLKQVSRNCFNGLISIDQLDLSQNNIETLPIDLFSECINLRKLDLASNNISIFEADCFKGLDKLTKLNFNNNSIEIIKDNYFTNLKSLQKLNLANNAINNLEENCFKNLKNLLRLELNVNRLKQLAQGIFSKCKVIDYLDLSSNDFDELPVEALKNLPNVRELYFENNLIQDLKASSFSGCANLKKLWLQENEIGEIDPNCFKNGNFTELIELNLAQNKLKNLKNLTFSYCENLETLNLSDNEFESFDQSLIKNLKKLNKLVLHQNKLKELPDDFECRKLRYLDLSGNDFTTLNSKWFQNLDELIDLDLKENKINNLSNHPFKDAKNLMYLNLSQNKISVVPKSFLDRNMINQNIRLMDVSDNNTQKIPPEIINDVKIFKNLEKINFAFNQIDINTKFFGFNKDFPKLEVHLKKCDFRFNQTVDDPTINFQTLFKIINTEKDIQHNLYIKDHELVIDSKIILFRRKLYGFETQLYLIYSNNKEKDLNEFEKLIDQVKDNEWSYLDFLLATFDFNSKSIISLKLHIEKKLTDNKNCFNYEFRIFSHESIVRLCERNDLALLDTFFPQETLLSYINNADIEVELEQFIKDEYEIFSKTNFIECMDAILKNGDQKFAIHFFIILKYSIKKHDSKNFENYEQFNLKFLNEYLPKIFEFNWTTLIKYILDFSIDDDFFSLTFFLKTRSDTKKKFKLRQRGVEPSSSEEMNEADKKLKEKIDVDKSIFKLIGDSQNGELLRHGTFQTLLRKEWRKLPQLIYYINLFIFLTFLSTFSADIEIYKSDKENLKYVMKIIPLVLISYFSILEIIQLLHHLFTGRIIDYFSSAKNVFELINFCLAIVALVLENSEAKSSIFSLAILFGFFVLLFRMDKVFLIGKYVRVIGKIIKRALGLLVFVLIFIIGFLLAFRNRSESFSDENSSMKFFNTTFEFGLYQVLSMSIGNLDLNEMGLSNLTENSLVNFLIYGVFIILIPILLINIFTGITIDEIQNLFKTSEEEAAITKINYIIKIQQLKKIPICGLFIRKSEKLIEHFKNFMDKIKSRIQNSDFFKKNFKLDDVKNGSEEDLNDVHSMFRLMDKKMEKLLFEMNNLSLQVEKANGKIDSLENRKINHIIYK
ncbi:unnamed protein product [Brachionus calyciflorus]|uniref:Ion transport domain-containing protein n=1 Tax=Brachionus calyciflorus TaxID=104777 RepID=A0A813VF23_9BILA|nr:unnamed protein product [Brachionus calyciflorus]